MKDYPFIVYNGKEHIDRRKIIMIYQHEYIVSNDYIELKRRVKAEMLRRDGYGSVEDYGNGNWDYPELKAGDKITYDHINKLAEPLRAINSKGIPTFEEGQVITANDLITLEKILKNYENYSRDYYFHEGHGDCAGACTGMCVTQCTTACTGSCTGDCTSTCTGSCQGSCTSCSGSCTSCSGTCSKGCIGSCTGGCHATCTAHCSNDCWGTCSGGCQNSCTSCSGSCSGGCSGCSGSCSGTCRGTCSGGCGGACGTSCIGSCHSGCTSSCSISCRGTCGNAARIGSRFVV